MDPNREGHRPEEINVGQEYPELIRPLSRDLAQLSRDIGAVGQESAEDNESVVHPSQNLPEEEKIEQAH